MCVGGGHIGANMRQPTATRRGKRGGRKEEERWGKVAGGGGERACHHHTDKCNLKMILVLGGRDRVDQVLPELAISDDSDPALPGRRFHLTPLLVCHYF